MPSRVWGRGVWSRAPAVASPRSVLSAPTGRRPRTSEPWRRSRRCGRESRSEPEGRAGRAGAELVSRGPRALGSRRLAMDLWPETLILSSCSAAGRTRGRGPSLVKTPRSRAPGAVSGSAWRPRASPAFRAVCWRVAKSPAALRAPELGVGPSVAGKSVCPRLFASRPSSDANDLPALLVALLLQDNSFKNITFLYLTFSEVGVPLFFSLVLSLSFWSFSVMGM